MTKKQRYEDVSFKPVFKRYFSRTILCLFIFILSNSSVFGQQSEKQTALDAKTQAVIIDSVTSALNEVYVFPETAQKMEPSLETVLDRKIQSRMARLVGGNSWINKRNHAGMNLSFSTASQCSDVWGQPIQHLLDSRMRGNDA